MAEQGAAPAKRAQAAARRSKTARKRKAASRPPPVATTAEAKSIVLFSDGTGNSSAKLFKTNVWRMYEAIDLGPAPPGKRNQIAYYDDGVGTSGFRPLAILGGVFGWGLKRNVLDIYQYACRNYCPGQGQQTGENPKRLGDHIYGFGFSRGAFTMRTAISLIADQGLVSYSSERELASRSRDAYRAYCGPGSPRYLKWLVRGYRAVRARLSSAWRKLRNIPLYDPTLNHRPVIRFIGVWDTVSAYGGPIAEITRAIDNWFWPLSMPNYKLNLEIERARHALAIDDERDSFQPLLWDEIHEQTLIAKRGTEGFELPAWIDEDRLEQVWFTGMHADVGGGYPDESLSYVSLLWMIEEVENADLRTLDIVTSRYRAMANSFGPMHDSRSGIGSYYRYQPRKIAAWLDPVRPSTLSLRDPAITDDKGHAKGLIPEGQVKVHESVIARIQDGTDSYAPIVLPERFQIVPPGTGGENQPQEDSDSPSGECVLRGHRRTLPLVAPAVSRRFTDPALSKTRSEATERLWNLVLLRRVTYFLTVLATFTLLSMPLWVDEAPLPLDLTGQRTFGWDALFLNDGRNWIGAVVRLLGLFLPGFLSGWVETYATNPFYFVLTVLLIVITLLTGKRLERRMRDEARAVWLPTTDRAVPKSAAGPRRPSLFQRIRTSTFYQRAVQIIKWHVLPNVIFTPILLLAISWIGLAIATQVALPGIERRAMRCGGSAPALDDIETVTKDFSTEELCNPMGGLVRKDTHYQISFQVKEPWADGRIPATPLGLPARDFRAGIGYLGVPLRRVMDANYLQPIIAIRSVPKNAGDRTQLYIYPLPLVAQGDKTSGFFYNGEFTAQMDGELFLFANDAVLPFVDRSYFYKSAASGNHGNACVSVYNMTPSPDAKPYDPATDASAICRELADEATRKGDAVAAASTAASMSEPVAEGGNERN